MVPPAWRLQGSSATKAGRRGVGAGRERETERNQSCLIFYGLGLRRVTSPAFYSSGASHQPRPSSRKGEWLHLFMRGVCQTLQACFEAITSPTPFPFELKSSWASFVSSLAGIPSPPSDMFPYVFQKTVASYKSSFTDGLRCASHYSQFSILFELFFT